MKHLVSFPDNVLCSHGILFFFFLYDVGEIYFLISFIYLGLKWPIVSGDLFMLNMLSRIFNPPASALFLNIKFYIKA